MYNGHPDSSYTQAVLRMLLPIGTYIQYLALDKGGETVKVTAKLVRFITKDLAIEVLVTSTLVASTEPDDGSEMVVTLDASTRIRDPEKMGDFYPLRHYIHECDEKKCKHKDDEKWRSDFHRMPQKTRPSSIPFRQGYWNERDIGIDYMGTTNILLNIVHSCIYDREIPVEITTTMVDRAQKICHDFAEGLHMFVQYDLRHGQIMEGDIVKRYMKMQGIDVYGGLGAHSNIEGYQHCCFDDGTPKCWTRKNIKLSDYKNVNESEASKMYNDLNPDDMSSQYYDKRNIFGLDAIHFSHMQQTTSLWEYGGPPLPFDEQSWHLCLFDYLKSVEMSDEQISNNYKTDMDDARYDAEEMQPHTNTTYDPPNNSVVQRVEEEMYQKDQKKTLDDYVNGHLETIFDRHRASDDMARFLSEHEIEEEDLFNYHELEGLSVAEIAGLSTNLRGSQFDVDKVYNFIVNIIDGSMRSRSVAPTYLALEMIAEAFEAIITKNIKAIVLPQEGRELQVTLLEQQNKELSMCVDELKKNSTKSDAESAVAQNTIHTLEERVKELEEKLTHSENLEKRNKDLESLVKTDLLDLTGVDDKMQIESYTLSVETVKRNQKRKTEVLKKKHKEFIQVKQEKIKLHIKLNESFQRKARLLTQSSKVRWQWEDGVPNSGWWNDYSQDDATIIETARQRLILFGIHEYNTERVTLSLTNGKSLEISLVMSENGTCTTATQRNCETNYIRRLQRIETDAGTNYSLTRIQKAVLDRIRNDSIEASNKSKQRLPKICERSKSTMTSDDFDRICQWFSSSVQLNINFDPFGEQKTLMTMNDDKDGRYLNLFEIRAKDRDAKGGGSNDLNKRNLWESTYFDEYSKNKCEPREHPKYGNVNFLAHRLGDLESTNYGKSYFILKPSIRRYSTITSDDLCNIGKDMVKIGTPDNIAHVLIDVFDHIEDNVQLKTFLATLVSLSKGCLDTDIDDADASNLRKHLRKVMMEVQIHSDIQLRKDVTMVVLCENDVKKLSKDNNLAIVHRFRQRFNLEVCQITSGGQVVPIGLDTSMEPATKKQKVSHNSTKASLLSSSSSSSSVPPQQLHQ